MILIARNEQEWRTLRTELYAQPEISHIMDIDEIRMLKTSELSVLMSLIYRFNRNEIGLLTLTVKLIQLDLLVFEFAGRFYQYSLHEFKRVLEKCQVNTFWNSSREREILYHYITQRIGNETAAA
jgi:hypothetical protein